MNQKMTERENLFHVLNRTGKAEWVPVAEDCYFTVAPAVIADRPDISDEKGGYDWFGMHWTYDKLAGACTPTLDHPRVISDITKWEEQMVLPDLEKIDWAAAAEKELEGLDREERALRVITESGPFERLWQLIGIEDSYMAMYDEPEAFKALIDVLSDFRIRIAAKVAEYYKPDLFLTMDDIGSAHSPLISMDMYREFIKPADAKLVKAITDLGMIPIYHSCGCMQVFVGDLVEIGSKVINPLQGGINDQEAVEAKYGDVVVFENCLDNLCSLPDTSEADIRAEVRRVIDLFGPKQNVILLPAGFLMPPENRAIIMDESRKYGGSPKA
jgi:uroporphyrinogen-III decarboxylase